MSLSDSDFLRQFEAFEILPSDFDHRAHLRLCWYCVENFGLTKAKVMIPTLIKNYVEHVGASDKYNHTLTMAAILIVASRMDQSSCNNFDHFINDNNDLLNNFKALIEAHYSEELIKSERARHQFVEPDLSPFCSLNEMTKLYPILQTTCHKLSHEFEIIPDDRKVQLLKLSAFITEEYKTGSAPKIIVICTHNSRRSHMGQLWLSASTEFYSLPKLMTYSGGTEATAFFPSAVQAMREVGFQIETSSDSVNPHYKIKWKQDMAPYDAFSTRFDDAPNPTKDFAAVMVCNSADEACPIVPGAKFRIALPFDDPKAFDNTSLESEKYLERCHDIGREMLFVLANVQLSKN